MKITYTQFVPDPSLRGKTTNLPAHVAQVLIAQGSAVAVPMPPRGSAGWLEARQEQSALAGAPDSRDTPVTFVDPPTWSIKEGNPPILIKTFGFEKTSFSTPPDDAPEDVKRIFAQHSNVNPYAAAVAVDAARRRQMEYDVKISTAKRW